MGYYKTSFLLQKNFGFSVAHLDTLYPYEFKIYIMEVMEYIKEENERLKKKQR
jgi:hypothetical protein